MARKKTDTLVTKTNHVYFQDVAFTFRPIPKRRHGVICPVSREKGDTFINKQFPHFHGDRRFHLSLDYSTWPFESFCSTPKNLYLSNPTCLPPANQREPIRYLLFSDFCLGHHELWSVTCKLCLHKCLIYLPSKETRFALHCNVVFRPIFVFYFCWSSRFQNYFWWL